MDVGFIHPVFQSRSLTICCRVRGGHLHFTEVRGGSEGASCGYTNLGIGQCCRVVLALWYET